MTQKRILFAAAAREKVLHGATALADAVRVTLGPKSKSVLIERKWGNPIVCDDGVTIAKELELRDPEENLGARMMRQAAERTGDAVGDGTTTATLLAHAIFSQGVRNVVAGASAIDLKRGLERGLKVALASLLAQAKPVTTAKEKAQVGAISAHNANMGQLVADAMEKVGPDGVISVEESKTTETSLEVVEGMQFDRGYISPYFVTDSERMECILEDALILVFGEKIMSLKDLIPLLEEVAKLGRPLLIIAEDVEGEALATLVVNRLRGTLQCAAVKAPGFGDRRTAMLEDIATLTGARYVSGELGMKLEGVRPAELGQARRVVVDKDTTTLVGGAGNKQRIAGRVAQVKKQIADTTSDYDREKLEERLAKLSGGVAVVQVGAPSESELKKLKESFEDAIHATKAAVAEGIVAGAGMALLRASQDIEKEEQNAEGDERTGMRILRQALTVPTRQIARNSGLDEGVVLERMLQGTSGIGLDAATGKYVNLIDAGIVDPKKVVRMALENAISIASVLLLTEATLTELPEEPKAHGAAASAEAGMSDAF